MKKIICVILLSLILTSFAEKPKEFIEQQPTVLCKGKHILEDITVELIEVFGQQFIIHRDNKGEIFGNLLKVNMSISEFSNYCIMHNYKPEC